VFEFTAAFSFATSTEYSPDAGFCRESTITSVGELPPWVNGTPLRIHWYLIGQIELATTLKVAVPLTGMIAELGCRVMSGASGLT
jgi:hypothetical protein